LVCHPYPAYVPSICMDATKVWVLAHATHLHIDHRSAVLRLRAITKNLQYSFAVDPHGNR